MKIWLDTEVFYHNNLLTEEVLYLLAVANNCDLERAKKSLSKKGFIDWRESSKEWVITDSGINALDGAVLDSDSDVPKKTKSLIEFASSLRNLFPKGMKKDDYGTPKWSWRGNAAEIEKRLRVFFREFGEYSQEEIYKATEHYVKRMTDDKFMKILPYFIWDKRGGDYSSPLATEIEMLKEGGVEDGSSDDWRNTLI